LKYKIFRDSTVEFFETSIWWDKCEVESEVKLTCMHLREENIIEQITLFEVYGCHIYQECLCLGLHDGHFYKIADFHEEREGSVLVLE
jgi:hypothetical protein